MRRGFSLLVSIGLGVMSALSALGAQAAVDPSMLQALQWRLVGPFRGGRVLAVASIYRDLASLRAELAMEQQAVP